MDVPSLLLRSPRHALRRLLRSPGFTWTTVLTLGLALGATTAVYGIVQGVLLEDLPFAAPEQLYAVTVEAPPGDGVRLPERLERAQARELLDDATTLAAVAGYEERVVSYRGRGEPARWTGARVSANLFTTLGVSPHRGPGFQAGGAWYTEEDRVMLSHGLWQRRFAGDLSLIGETVTLDDRPHVVAGVLPPGFAFPHREVEVWLSQAPPAALPGGSFNFAFLPVVVRLAPGTTPGDAEAEMARLLGSGPGMTDLLGPGAAEASAGMPSLKLEGTPRLVGLRESMVGAVRTPLGLLAGAVALVLLIAGVNLANLLLARHSRRRKEVAIRRALGAGRGRLVAEMLPESVLLALAGGAVGLGVATLVLRSLSSWVPGELPRAEAISVDPGVFFFTFALSLATGLLCGLLPALRATGAGRRRSPSPGLADQLRSAMPDPRADQGWRRFLIVAEVALAVMVMVGASLLVRSYGELNRVDPGFTPDDAVVASLELGLAYGGEGQRRDFFDRLVERLAAHPRVTAAGTVAYPPLQSGFGMNDVQVVGEEPGRTLAVGQSTDPGYLRAAGLELLEGEWISSEDHAAGAPVAVVNRSFASRYVSGGSAVGRSVERGSTTFRIVGVVEDVRMVGLDREAKPALYSSYRLGNTPARMGVVLRVAGGGDVGELVAFLRAAVGELDPDLAVGEVATLRSRLATSTAEPRFYTLLLGIFGALATVLAASGVYALLAGFVAGQTRSIGVRRALGARFGDVMALVLSEGMVLVALGLVVGLAGAALASRLLADLLFEVTTGDAASYTAAALLVLLVASLACWLPARRALAVDPLDALRHE